MTAPDHRSRGRSGAGAAATGLAGAAYLLPALAYYSGPLRRLLGISRTTLDGRGYALTFDDGPHPQGTPRVLAALAARGAVATFFLVGEQV
ncbi:MAG TPA: polysaccharide deacetylase family protein, partial [Solirubrobacteraceae bacterium]|nr:polysaccharide deacetylase family protein [Solirubrobacteraceae bacterium]